MALEHAAAVVHRVIALSHKLDVLSNFSNRHSG